MDWNLILGIIAGYFIGSIPFGLIVTKLAGKGDIRKVGSGNIGATNAMRVGGWKLALPVLALDLLKAFAAVNIFGVWAGFAAIVGHNYPVWLRFKGGKGFAATAGFAAAVSPVLFAFGLLEWLIVAFSFGYSSLAALTVLAISPAWGFALSDQIGWATVAMAALGYWRHRENIRRLLSGTESKISWKKSR